MQIKKALAAAACGIIILATACHKDKDKNNTTTTPKTPTDYLTDAKWKTTSYRSFYADADTSYSQDYYQNGIDACAKDDFEIYLTNGTIVDNVGVLKCDSTEDQTDSTGRWLFIDNNSKLVFSYDSSSDTAVILQLNATTLKYAMNFSDPVITERDTITCTNIK